MEDELISIEWPRSSLGLSPLKFDVVNQPGTWLVTYRRISADNGRLCSTTFELARAVDAKHYIRYRRHLLDPRCETEPNPPCDCSWKYGAWALKTPSDLFLVEYSSRGLYPTDELSFAASFFGEARQKLNVAPDLASSGRIA
jgi:hypothetical protein